MALCEVRAQVEVDVACRLGARSVSDLLLANLIGRDSHTRPAGASSTIASTIVSRTSTCRRATRGGRLTAASRIAPVHRSIDDDDRSLVISRSGQVMSVRVFPEASIQR